MSRRRTGVMSQQEVADELGITQQAVADMERKAIRKFKENWQAMFNEPVPYPTERYEQEPIPRTIVIELNLGDYI